MFEPLRGFDTPLTTAPKNPRFLCRPSATLSRAPEGHLECSCSRGADSRRPKGPNRADNGSKWLLYTSRSGRAAFLYQTGVLTPDTPPRSRPQEHGWTRGVRHRKMRESFSERLRSTYSPPGSGVRRLSTLLS